MGKRIFAWCSRRIRNWILYQAFCIIFFFFHQTLATLSFPCFSLSSDNSVTLVVADRLRKRCYNYCLPSITCKKSAVSGVLYTATKVHLPYASELYNNDYPRWTHMFQLREMFVNSVARPRYDNVWYLANNDRQFKTRKYASEEAKNVSRARIRKFFFLFFFLPVSFRNIATYRASSINSRYVPDNIERNVSLHETGSTIDRCINWRRHLNWRKNWHWNIFH